MNTAVAVCLQKLELVHEVFVERCAGVVVRFRRESLEHELFRFLVVHDCGLDCVGSILVGFGVVSVELSVVFLRSSCER